MLDQTKLVEVSRVVKSIKDNKSAGSHSIVGELIKYGCMPMCEMLLTLFYQVWNKYVLDCWRDGPVVVLLRKKIGKTALIIEM